MGRARGSGGVDRARSHAVRARKKARARKKGRDWRGKIKSFAGGSHLAQGAEALAVDGGLVHENLVGAVVGGDEAEALLGVEPLDLRVRRGGRGEVRRLRENSSIHAPARRCGRIHSPPSRRSPPDGGRDARGAGSVIERTLPVTLPVIVVAVSRWDCGPVGMRASRGRRLGVFVSFRGATETGGKNIGRAIRFHSPARHVGRMQTLVSGSARFVTSYIWMSSLEFSCFTVMSVDNTRVFQRTRRC